MKKGLLFILSIGLAFSVSAQKSIKQQSCKATTPVLNENRAAQPIKNYKNHSTRTADAKSKAITVVDLGNSGNAYGYYNGGRTCLWYDKDINTLAFAHRGGPATNPVNSGNKIAYDLSTDGGATWTSNKGPAYIPATPASSIMANCRYPQGAIYSPAGNTNPANAKLTYFAAATLGGGWLRCVYGTASPITTCATIAQYACDSLPGDTNDLGLQVEDAFHVTKSGNTWVIGESNVNGADYNDYLMFRKGTITSTGMTMVQDTSYYPTVPKTILSTGEKVSIPDMKVAFTEDGQIGYAGFLSLVDSTGLTKGGMMNLQDEGYYPCIIKTTDGGLTWTWPKQVVPKKYHDIKYNLVSDDRMAELLDVPVSTIPAKRDSAGYVCGFFCDLVLDKNNNPHLLTTVHINLWDGSGTPFSVLTAHDLFGMVHFFSPDGGITWEAKILDRLWNMRGAFGGINEDNRPQISRSWDGSKIFMSWLETDTTVYPGVGNANPDIMFVGFSVDSSKYTDLYNVTKGTDLDGQAFMAGQSYYAMDIANGYKVPFVTMMLGTDDTQPVTYKYVDGFTLTNADFKNAFVSVNNQVFAQDFVSQNQPNPCKDDATINITLKNSSNVNVNVTNMMGQVVKSMDLNLQAGTNQVKINVSDLSSGVYFYTVQAEGKVATKKMIVE